MKEEIDEAYYFGGVDHLLRSQYGGGAVLREPGGERQRQGASRRREDELREEMQEGRLRKQSGERGGQAASRRGEEQLHGKVREGCLERWFLARLARRAEVRRRRRGL
jgi:hypothetical protein